MWLAEEAYLAAGKWIGRNYQVIRKLGNGGDGTVYLVRHIPTEQLRAAKELRETLWKRRVHELDMMKRLTHPAFPRVFDFFEDQGKLWLIMEFIKGKTLSELDPKKMNAALFFSIAGQLAETLAYLHTRRPPVLHLDIKPSNVMLRPEGRLVLLDFGAAVRVDLEDRGSARFGTPGFAAPEQAAPDTALDARADIYGYGALLYYCLFGKAPDSEGESRRKLLSVKTVWKRMAAPLLLRCLREDREERFQDVRCLCRSAGRTERRYRLYMQLRKGGAAALLLAAVLLFAASQLPQEGQGRALSADAGEEYEEYEALLEQADSLGFEQAVSCYEQAIHLCPEDGAWCERFLERVEEDYSFSTEEEAALKKLIFLRPQGRERTVCELFEESSASYGELAYRIGLEYWYFYEGAGGRSAAARWFERAVASQDSLPEGSAPEWMKSALIYAGISSYYEKLGKQDMVGKQMADLGKYWEDLEVLWETEEAGQEQVEIRLEIAKEIISTLVLQTYDLAKNGVKVEQMRKMLNAVKVFIEESGRTGKTAEMCREQYEAAQEAVERVADKERRIELDK